MKSVPGLQYVFGIFVILENEMTEVSSHKPAFRPTQEPVRVGAHSSRPVGREFIRVSRHSKKSLLSVSCVQQTFPTGSMHGDRQRSVQGATAGTTTELQ